MPNTGLRILFGPNYHKWSWVQEQLSFTTPYYIAEKVSHLVHKTYCKKNNLEPVVWDMFAGLGGDAIQMAKRGFKVYCTEISPEIFYLLNKNIVNNRLATEIQAFKCDAVQKVGQIEADVIYFDPPWGRSFEPNTEFSFLNVTLDNGINVIDLLRTIATKNREIIIKSPLNCKTFESLGFIKIQKTYIFKKHNLKFLLCF